MAVPFGRAPEQGSDHAASSVLRREETSGRVRGALDKPLLEREAELAALWGLVERAVAGSGGLAVIEGPAGIGKTRLLRAAGELTSGDAV